MVEIKWSKQAVEDIYSIKEYYSNFSNSYSFQLIDQIFQKAEILIKFPEIGRIIPELNNQSIRELIFKNFRIIYAIHDLNRITILTVHSSSKPLSNLSLFD
ncbi:type II toxin-antitoxin system RelE/ParE family toxin [Algoriphagus marinus]|uniref:type II toxin-antitoxin system RelE/ParE family toxin n=1 Tax=Algoriphagus marinus TaxID=1925762 RepID=UPI00094B8CB7|nr:type II toxin-antitoxin system RelE/ParE family toxin [Algoriphagus marinus]